MLNIKSCLTDVELSSQSAMRKENKNWVFINNCKREMQAKEKQSKVEYFQVLLNKAGQLPLIRFNV